MNRSLFLTIVVLSTLSARSSFAAESAPAPAKTQGKTQATTQGQPQVKSEVQKPAVVEVKSQAAPKMPALDKKVNEATTPKTPNVKDAATVKTTSGKAVSEKSPEKSVRASKRAPAAGLVPPPPPDTPTLMGLPEGDYDSLANLEYMSLSAMKERQKELNTQLLDAQEELKSRQRDATELKGKATQFENLYTEGVISKHELEVSKKEASEIDARISRAKMRVEDLQSNIKRLNDRLKEQERRLARVKKNTTTSKNKLAIVKKGASKPADKAPLKTDKLQGKAPNKTPAKTSEKADKAASEEAATVKPDAVQTPVKSEQPAKTSLPNGENKSDEL
jgi:hypothetical protein